MLLIKNKKAKFNYHILETFSAGVSLLGIEVKSLKQKSGNINNSYVLFKKNEKNVLVLFLVGAAIPPYQPNNIYFKYNPERERQLLLNKSELNRLIGKIKIRGITLIPLEIYTSRGLIKLKFGVGKGKKKRDKRECIKKRDRERDVNNIVF